VQKARHRFPFRKAFFEFEHLVLEDRNFFGNVHELGIAVVRLAKSMEQNIRIYFLNTFRCSSIAVSSLDDLSEDWRDLSSASVELASLTFKSV
jgi:hypothetical protein